MVCASPLGYDAVSDIERLWNLYLALFIGHWYDERRIGQGDADNRIFRNGELVNDLKTLDRNRLGVDNCDALVKCVVHVFTEGRAVDFLDPR